MKKYLYVREEVEIQETVDVDVEINLEHHIDEIIEFLRENHKAQEKIKTLGASDLFRTPMFYFTKEEIGNKFSLSSKQLEAHLKYRSDEDHRTNLTNHYLLIKEGVIEGIFTTNGHILIISANNIEDCLTKILDSSYELKLFNFQLGRAAPAVSLSSIDGTIYSHFNYVEETVSSKILLKENLKFAPIKEVIEKTSKDFKDSSGVAVTSLDGVTKVDFIEEKLIGIKFSSFYFEALNLLNKDYRYSIKEIEDRIACFKDENNAIFIIPIK